MRDDLFNELNSLIYTTLKLDCPVLSGNMQSHINIEETTDDFTRISVSGPSYDGKKWRKTGIIEHDGKYDYAVSVNALGAFYGRSKKSKHWANKSIVKVCQIIAAKYNAEVIVNVGL